MITFITLAGLCQLFGYPRMCGALLCCAAAAAYGAGLR